MPEPLLGADFEVWTSATEAGTYVIVDGLTSFRTRSNRGSSSTAIFGRSVNVTIPGSREVTASAEGVAIPDDPGQAIWRSAEEDNDTCWIEVRYATGKKYTREVRIGSKEHGADDPEGLQTMSWELTAAGAGTPASGSVVP